MVNPYKVVEDFELAIAEFTGAPYCVAVDSCTNALQLSFRYLNAPYTIPFIDIPKRTYVGVAQAMRSTGCALRFRDEKWVGEYNLCGGAIVDAAKWLRRDMYRKGTLTCLSFQAYKQLPIGRGGAILCDELTDAEWLRQARFDGRDMSVSLYDQKSFSWGMHCQMPPDAAARGLWLLQGLPKNMPPIGSWADYPDLSLKEWL
jgi:dTDP-4-amino-4,6-dideoxygalactose transaminase